MWYVVIYLEDDVIEKKTDDWFEVATLINQLGNTKKTVAFSVHKIGVNNGN